MPYAELSDITLYYEVSGPQSAPPLLIIAGIGDPLEKCAWQISELAQNFRVIVADNRGVGRSTKSDPGYTMADLAHDSAGLLNYLEIEKTNVFGYSMGGMIALNLTVLYPERVQRLALGCTTAGGSLGVQPDEKVLMAMMHPESSGDQHQDYLNGVWISLSSAFVSDYPETVEELARLAAGNGQTEQSYAGQFEAVLSHDVANRVADIDVSVLVMHGDSDLLIPPENGRLLAENIPGAKLIMYPGAGHLFFIEQANQVNLDLLSFFREGENG